jgi:hypothetical protein
MGLSKDEVLNPGACLQFRQALRRPQPAERDYLEAQATGVGLLVGEHARCLLISHLL